MTLCFIGRHWWKDVEGDEMGRGRVCLHCSKKEIYWQKYRSWDKEWLSISEVEKDLEDIKRGGW